MKIKKDLGFKNEKETMMKFLFYIIYIFTFVTSMVTHVFSQELHLTNDAKMFIIQDGIIFSTASLKLNKQSQIHGVEDIKLKKSGFIELASSEAKAITGLMSPNNTLKIPIGIQSKTVVSLKSLDKKSKISIGISPFKENGALPYQWSIESTSTTDADLIDIEFSWEKKDEPKDFDLKALLNLQNENWDIIQNQLTNDQKILAPSFTSLKKGTNKFIVKQFDRDLDEDDVPDIREIEQGSNMLDPGDYFDSDEDGVPNYVENSQNTNPLDAKSYLDLNQNNIPDYLELRSPIAFLNLKDITIPWGKVYFQSMLNDSVDMILGSGKIINLYVPWDASLVNVYARGAYAINGKLNLPSGIFNSFDLKPTLVGNVLPKPKPLDLLITNNEFKNEGQKFIIPIGAFTPIDPVDNIHIIQLTGTNNDNRYFEIKENTLYWNSSERAAGQIKFTVQVRLTDRDGNQLDETFEITRLRNDLKEIPIYNNFTPNQDGTNDTWGVSGLREYKGVRIQVFERSGNRVFYTEDPDIRWDGTTNTGKKLSVGTYFWIVEIKEIGETRKGVVNLLFK
jgi:gliding motility-associated-like protein